MAEPVTMYEFIGASPGYDVLEYRGGDNYHAVPVVAWAIVEHDGAARAFPITTSEAWAFQEEHTIMAPDGTIRCGELEEWASITQWLDTMRNRKVAESAAIAPAPLKLSNTNGVLALDSYRHKFQQPPHGDGS